jgi:hypothetical protein
MGRAVQGVRLMDLAPGEKVVSMARLAERDDETGGDDGDAGDSDGDSGGSGGDASEG